MSRITLFLTLLLLAGVEGMNAQPDLRAQLFGDTEKALQQAREKKADIYAPRNFSKGMDAYNDADDYFRKGKPLDKIQERLRDATAAFNRSVEAASLGEKTFSVTMAARTDAVNADASTLCSAVWNDAESSFRDAAKDLEDGNLSDARKEGLTAEGLYRKAELESIKTKYLSPVRSLLKQADNLDTRDDAPKTLAKAQRLANESETQFAQNRYNNAAAQTLAEEARAEASHALYLQHSINQLKRDNRTYEDILLTSEEPLRKIAAAANVPVAFDSGYGPPTQRILGVLSTPDAEMSHMTQKVKTQDSTIIALNARLSALERKSTQLPDATADHKARLDDVVSQIRSMFIPDEATVQIDGNNVLLRLFAVTFAPGRSALDAQARSMLARVTQSIMKLPGCQVSIEGHTEPVGSEIANQRNSEERAESVATYLRANLPATIAVTFAGYGGTRPVGTPGRNKRIDVVIVPEWAIVGK